MLTFEVVADMPNMFEIFRDEKLLDGICLYHEWHENGNWMFETDYTYRLSSSELRQIADKLDILNSPSVGDNEKTTISTDDHLL